MRRSFSKKFCRTGNLCFPKEAATLEITGKSAMPRSRNFCVFSIFSGTIKLAGRCLEKPIAGSLSRCGANRETGGSWNAEFVPKFPSPAAKLPPSDSFLLRDFAWRQCRRKGVDQAVPDLARAGRSTRFFFRESHRVQFRSVTRLIGYEFGMKRLHNHSRKSCLFLVRRSSPVLSASGPNCRSVCSDIA